jgi:hypothetical protein
MGDFAYQCNDSIDLEAWAGRLTASYAFANLAWSPTLTLGYQTFSVGALQRLAQRFSMCTADHWYCLITEQRFCRRAVSKAAQSNTGTVADIGLMTTDQASRRAKNRKSS